MTDFDASAYNISIVRRPVEGHLYFVGRVTEFPHIQVYEESWVDSYEAVRSIIEDLFAEATEMKEPFPQPLAEEIASFSGRVTARLPRWLHARLDAQAKSEEISLNSHMVTLLAMASAGRAYAQGPVETSLSSPGTSTHGQLTVR